ncbi:MAG TPA: hypothetical protein VFI65_33305 [Streptosporangiaceae bacterium]|nr:hypothetical protein [Streptosporangiaceae bacterium]
MTYECNCIAVDVSMPDDLVSAVRDFVGAELFDKYIATAVEQRLRLDLIDELSAELHAEFGPIPAEVRKLTAKTWPA